MGVFFYSTIVIYRFPFHEDLQDQYDRILHQNYELQACLSRSRNERDLLQISTEMTPLRPTRSTRTPTNSFSNGSKFDICDKLKHLKFQS